jgi:large subunit ribosomal protein L30
MTELLVVQTRSAIGEKEAARGTLRALGLGRPGARAHLEDTPQLRGMLRKVAHLIEVTEKESATA